MTGASSDQALAQAREIEGLREHARVYLSVLVDQDDEITALKAEVATLNRLRVQLSEDSQMHLDRAKAAEAEVAHLRIALARADGALADAETVQTGDLERGIRALTAERDGLRGALARLIAALDVCEATRGRFSCSYPHDNRCPKARAEWAADWRGVWQCECGAEELEATVDTARPSVVGGREEGK